MLYLEGLDYFQLIIGVFAECFAVCLRAQVTHSTHPGAEVATLNVGYG